MDKLLIVSGQKPWEEADFAGEALEEEELAEPPKYSVIMHNDDYTTMDFVIEVLIRFFGHTHERAMKIMLQIHEKGRGTAGTYSFEIAETKANQVMNLARDEGHPLRCTIEPVD